MSCCNNPIELNCITKCDLLVIPVAVTSLYTIKTEFNGILINLDFAINNSNYAVIDISELNEDYFYTIGVWNASGTQAGCYKVKIMPSSQCCDTPSTDVTTKRILADYVTLNSDNFLTDWVALGKAYGYRCTSASYNGVSVNTGDKMIFSGTENLHIAVQTAPRDTIPEHDTNNGSFWLTYDKNWIDFLQSLPIADYLTFSTSPFSGAINTAHEVIKDHGYPEDETMIIATNEVANIVYGEGFMIERNYPSTFTFTVEYIYAEGGAFATVENPYGVETVGHTIVFRDDAYFIDGGKIYPANTRVIQAT